MDFSPIKALTFDCYGTLIDWEAGILAALRRVLSAHDRELPDAELLKMYAQFEGEAQAGSYKSYRSVLRMVTYEFASRLGFGLDEGEDRILPESVAQWPAFPDTVAALRALKARYRLCVLSNIDDDMIAATVRNHLLVEFDEIVSAQQVKSYKPGHAHFHEGLRRLGLEPHEVLHVGESRRHDIVPAKALGIPNAWVQRRAAAGSTASASGAADVQADLVVPDMASLARLAT